MEEEITYTPVTTGRYISSKLLDVFLSVLTFFLLLPGTLGIINSLPNYVESSFFISKVQVESHLYMEKDGIRLSSYIDSLNKTVKEKNEIYETELTYFYSDYLFSKGVNLNRFEERKANAKIDGLNMFDQNGNRALTNIDYDNSYLSFYKGFYESIALSDLTYVPHYAESRRNMIVTRIVTYVTVSIICYTIFFLVIPLIFYKGKRSIGMILNKLVFVDQSGLSVSWKRYLAHFAFEFFFIFIGSLAALLIPLAISIAFIVTKPTKQSLTDYVTGTYLVMKEDSNYLTKKELLNSKINN